MTSAELGALVRRIRIIGWDVKLDGRNVSVRASVSPKDSRAHGVFAGLGESFHVPESWDVMHVVRRLFATVQYLTDHELREGFEVDGYRPFDPHLPESLTGRQHDWWVEQQSAVRGY